MVHQDYALEALLHDATDAYFGDAATLVKRSPYFSGFWQAEKDLQEKIYSAFGLYPTESSTATIHEADKLLMRMEASVLVAKPRTAGWESYDLNERIEYLGKQKIQCWHPATAYNRFMARFRELSGPVAKAKRQAAQKVVPAVVAAYA